MKTGALVHCHEDSKNLQLGLVMNNRTKMASDQSKLLKFVDWKHWQKGDFYKQKGPGKVCNQICQDFKIGTLKVFLE